MKFRRLMIFVVVAVMLSMIAPVAAQSKVATVLWTQEPDNLNPMYTTMTFSALLRDFWLPGAWAFDEDLNPVPVLVTEIPSAENGGISEDGLVMTLNLRDDINWSDGEPITASDFVFTYDMVMSEDNIPLTRNPYDPYVSSVEAVDPLTVVLNFAVPYAPWLSNIFTWVLPEHVLAPVFEAEGTLDNAAWNRMPTVGSGPYVVSEWETGSHILFARNDNYFGGDVILDGVFVRFVPDDASQTAALIAGDGDIGYFVPFSDIPQLEDAGVNVVWVPAGYNEGWFFNFDPATGHPAMQDVNVRKALAMAFNRWAVTDDLLLGETYPAVTFWENTPFSPPDLEAYPYDPQMAMDLLDAAGWVDTNGDGTRDKDGVELVLRYSTPPRQVRMDTQVVVQQQFEEVGIGLILENPSYDIYFNSYGSGGPIAIGDFDIGQWSSNTDFPDPNIDRFKCAEAPSDENPEGNNWGAYCNPELDELFELQAVTTDYEKRVEIFHEISNIMFEDVAWLGVWHDPDNFAINGRLQNVRINGATPFWNCNEWDIAG